MLKPLSVCLLLSIVPQAAAAASVFTARPDDPAAIHVDLPGPPSAVDDHTALLQAALDRAAANPAGGLVLVPAGRYNVRRTLIVWRAVRIVGYGATRPLFVLPERTEGFQTGLGVMVHFTNARPGGGGPGGPARVAFPPPGLVPPNDAIPSANQTTFYSSMANVDFEIGDGNPAAVAVRFHVAQHGILSDIDFRIGSGLAGVIEVGNVGQRLRFLGGRFGIMATNTSPFWPYTLIDSEFDGQRDAAIREHQTGLTVVRTTFRNTPVGISIDKGYADNLWLKDARFERVGTTAILSDPSDNALMQIGAEGVVCVETPVFARERGSHVAVGSGGAAYRVRRFHHGLFVRGSDSTGSIDELTDVEPLTAAPAPLAPALPALPPMEQWVNVRTLGVKGDGKTDDTKALQAAVDGTRVLYFPSGTYVVRDTIGLKPDTVLIALHPGTTRIDLADRVEAFAGVGEPKAVLQAPQGGRTIVSGLGVFAGATNPRATAVLWMAGRESFLNDLMVHWFAPGPPASGPGGGRARSGAQYPSVWVTKGGGGTFHSIWSAAPNAQSGFYVSDTTTPGVVYELSAEHHLYGEIVLDRVENWEFHGPQTEEEVSSSPEAVAFEIKDSKNITIANYKAYRVTRSYNPFPAAIRVYGSSGIRLRNVSVNAEHGYGVCDDNGCGTKLRSGKFAFDNAVEDVTNGREVRERLFAVLDLNPPLRAAASRDRRPVPVLKATVEKLAGDFHSISGAAVDAAGTLYFVDRHQQRIFSWSPSARLKIVRDAPLDAVNLGVDTSGNLLVLSMAGRAGTVFSFRPDGPRDALTVLQPQARPAGKDATFLLPSTVWADGQFRSHLDLKTYEYETLAEMFSREVTTAQPKAYVSPDGSVVLPAFRVFTQGPGGQYPGMDETGWRWSHTLDAFSLVPARPGERVYLTSGAENRTWRGVVRDDGTVGDLAPFAERGGESVTADREGNVYVANGQIFVYRPTGELAGRIDVPERPTGLRFGGSDGRTLFVLTHHSLYGVKIP